jgi:TIR domain
MAGPIPTASGRIFISYRREETAYPAGWLYDRLADRFGGGQVFKDVDSIQLGDDFVEVITRAVGSCDVLLALIGAEWLTITDEHGQRRLDKPDDFVRLEIEAALTRGVRVIPILLDGARMPRTDELPASLAKLVRRQALELSPARFDFDTSRLLKVLDATLTEARTAQDEAPSMGAPARKTPDPSATELPKVPERPEQAGQSHRPSVPRAAPVPPGGARLASDGGEPSGKQRRRLSTGARILAGVGVGVALILLIVAIVANSQTTSPSAANGGESGVSGLAVVPQTDCTRTYFAQRPPVDSSRVRSVELEAQDRRVLGVGERQDTEFGLVLSDTLSSTVPQVLGEVKLFHRPGVGFHVISVVDEQTCQPVGVSLASEPGVPAPAALGDDPRVIFTLGGTSYAMLLNGHTDVEVTLTRSG